MIQVHKCSALYFSIIQRCTLLRLNMLLVLYIWYFHLKSCSLRAITNFVMGGGGAHSGFPRCPEPPTSYTKVSNNLSDRVCQPVILHCHHVAESTRLLWKLLKEDDQLCVHLLWQQKVVDIGSAFIGSLGQMSVRTFQISCTSGYVWNSTKYFATIDPK